MKPRKKKSLDTLLNEAGLSLCSYEQQYAYITEQIALQHVRPVLASPRNGKKPPLHTLYHVTPHHVVEETLQTDALLYEMDYMLAPEIGKSYYRKHIETYCKERNHILLLSTFFHKNKHLLNDRVSCNERSFQIWGDEKFLSKASKTLLKHCDVNPDSLNYYETSEPFSYFSLHRNVPQTVLFVENKDTFFSIRKAFFATSADPTAERRLFGEAISTVIYAAGNSITKSVQAFRLSAEPHLCDANNRFLYFGDFDYEGIAIYYRTADAFQLNVPILPFREAYLAMLKSVQDVSKLPCMRQQTIQNMDRFYAFFAETSIRRMQAILAQGRYVPQESITYADFVSAMTSD